MEIQKLYAGLYQKFGRHYSKNSIVFLEGDSGEEMYIILAGKIEINKMIKTEEKVGNKVLAVLGPGDFFGEMSLLNDKPRSATAIVLDDAKVLVLNKQNFEMILEKQPKLAIKMLKVMSNRVRAADEYVKAKEEENYQISAVSPSEIRPEVTIEKEEKEREELVREVKTEEVPTSFLNLENIIYGFYLSSLLNFCLHHQIFDLIKNGINKLDLLVEDLGWDAYTLELILGILTSINILAKEEEEYILLSEYEDKLLQDKASFAGELSNFVKQYSTPWQELEKVVKFGKSPQEILEEERRWMRRFLQAKGISSAYPLEYLIRHFEMSNVKKMLEVGENPGVYSIELVRRFPQISSLVMDREENISLTDDYIAQFQLGDKVAGQVGDYYKADFGKNNDLLLMNFVFHNKDEERMKSILSRAFSSLRDEGIIAIHDFFLREDRTFPYETLILGLNLLVNTVAGKVYAENEINSWLREVGFRNIDINSLSDSTYIIIAQKL